VRDYDWQLTLPSPTLTPVGVVEAMLAALGRGDVATCYNFASPNSNVGRQKFDLIVRHSPAYAPLVRLSRYAIVGVLPLSDSAVRCRVRVWPERATALQTAGPAVRDYDWQLTREPESSIDYTSAGCWMVENVRPDSAPRDVSRDEIARLSSAS
jgi:hypothetical protein